MAKDYSIEELARLFGFEYELCRKEQAELKGLRLPELDKIVQEERKRIQLEESDKVLAEIRREAHIAAKVRGRFQADRRSKAFVVRVVMLLLLLAVALLLLTGTIVDL